MISTSTGHLKDELKLTQVLQLFVDPKGLWSIAQFLLTESDSYSNCKKKYASIAECFIIIWNKNNIAVFCYLVKQKLQNYFGIFFSLCHIYILVW